MSTPDQDALNLGFWIERRIDVHVLVWASQGCRPATKEEVAMWERLCPTETDDDN